MFLVKTCLIAPISKGMRWLLLAAGLLVLLAGFQLFILTEYTDRYFAWTIQPFITAAFLGGGYFASFLVEFLAFRNGKWPEGRIAVPAVFTFTTLTLIATLLHVDRFHFNSPLVLARAAAWFWLGIYAVVPPLMLLMWVRQHRISSGETKASLPLPESLRLVLIIQGVVMLSWGAFLFLEPKFSAASWPWTLTPLTSQAIGAWLIGIGVLAVHGFVENDYARIRIGLVGYLAFGVLEVVALLRYSGSFSWLSWSGWLYVGLIVSVLITGLYATKSITQKSL
jgi:hypothetical protein